jgi:hypothetical protein
MVLAVSPWTLLWRRNAFLGALPWLGAVMANPFVRGAVTGIGIVTFAAGVRDLFGVIFARSVTPAAPSDDGTRAL